MSEHTNPANARSSGAAMFSAAVAAGAVSGVASIINEARKRGKTTSDHATEVVRANIDQSSSDLRERLGPVTEAAKERFATLESSGRAQAGKVASQVSERAASIAEAASQSNLRPRFEQARSQLDEVVSDVVERGRKAVPAYASEIESLAEKHVLPRLHDATQRVSSFADDVVTSGRERGKQATDQIASEVKGTVDDAGKRFAESLSHAEKSIGGWRGNASSLVGDVESTAKTAAGQAAKGGRNAGATALWIGAAGAVIYAGLLNSEQRKKLRNAGARTFHEAIEIYRDVRGRDGTFGGPGTTPTA